MINAIFIFISRITAVFTVYLIMVVIISILSMPSVPIKDGFNISIESISRTYTLRTAFLVPLALIAWYGKGMFAKLTWNLLGILFLYKVIFTPVGFKYFNPHYNIGYPVLFYALTLLIGICALIIPHYKYIKSIAKR